MDRNAELIGLEDLVFEGRGEFEFRQTYVVAEVMVHAGIVKSISFLDEKGRPPKGADQICGQLRDKPLSAALEVKAKELDSSEKRSEDVVKVAMLEAFHRAIEACLNEE